VHLDSVGRHVPFWIEIAVKRLAGWGTVDQLNRPISTKRCPSNGSSPVISASMTISRMVRGYSILLITSPAGVACGGHQRYRQPISRWGSPMQQQFFQVFRLAFNLFKAVIYIVLTIALWIDLSQVHSLIETELL
jgi:hypothetical protein